MLAFVVMLAWTSLAGLPPLTEPQRVQLDTADDADRGWDLPALYPLLDNAASWDLDPAALVPGSIVLDTEAVLRQPGPHRGRVMIVEGRLAEARELKLLRPGRWGETVMRWVVQVDPQRDEVVVVLLTHPPPRPPLGARVRMPARFYKLWPSRTIDGEPITYITLVGHGAAVLDAGPSAPADAARGSGGGSVGLLLLLSLVVAGVFVFMLRRMMRLSLTPAPLPSQVRRQQAAAAARLARTSAPDDPPGNGHEPPLPDNPEDALAELERRQAQADSSPPRRGDR